MPGTVLSSGTVFAENPIGCMFFVYSNVLVASATGGGTALALGGNTTIRAATAARNRNRLHKPIERPPHSPNERL